ncbi:hypothetical protein GON26_10135 [Flavobacterium sp. GA093]|uniref:HEAT repeat domain-containing protein n=1 Tax=Flavobacterium hydrocarbonoxydans TaxID=2683249 RepID=A0A6I4NL19_9FLAO|nr:hypothetical protein [Flavobacterium hydrocarbonoxydans]MWB94723.1 hypothetical protein [Flavobacterium hydrocarbonoxydans]
MEQFIMYLKYYVIPFLLISTIFFTFLLLLKRIRHQYYLVYKNSIARKADSFLTEITLSKLDNVTLIQKVSEFKEAIPIHKSWCKEMLIDDMIRLKNNLKGKTAKTLNRIYKLLDLDHYSAGLIRDFRNYKKCQGFYHFQSLDYKPGISLIKKYLFHPNKIIRSNANIAYIILSKGDWQAVDTLPVKISILNTIKVMDIFHSKKIPMPENVVVWIASKNRTILKLAIMTMVFYNYRKNSAEIINLLHDEDISLKIDVIRAIRELFLEEAEAELLILFEREPLEIQLEILKTLKIIGSPKTIAFLRNRIINEPTKDLKLKMVTCLNQLDRNTVNSLGLLDQDTQKMIDHVRQLQI